MHNQRKPNKNGKSPHLWQAEKRACRVYLVKNQHFKRKLQYLSLECGAQGEKIFSYIFFYFSTSSRGF